MRIAALVIATLVTTGCVSVKLATEDSERATPDKVKFKEPSKPFAKTDLSQADRAWQSPKTGNSISYFSDCKASPQSLKSIRTNLFTGIESLKVIDENLSNFNEREALKSIVLGKMEGVPIKVNLLIFKKNMCTYSLSYVALVDQYEQELSQFTKFVESFVVND